MFDMETPECLENSVFHYRYDLEALDRDVDHTLGIMRTHIP